MRERVEVVEQERDSLKTSLKEEEVARIAAEGRISLPSPTEDEMREASPQKETGPLTAEVPITDDDAYELAAIKEELRFARTRAIKAEDMVDFMQMECQFRCCSCRVAEWHEKGYVHDGTLAAAMEHMRQEKDRILSSMDNGQALLQDTALIPESEHHLSGVPAPGQSQQQPQRVSGTNRGLIHTADVLKDTLPAESLQTGETLRSGEDIEPEPAPIPQFEESHPDPVAMTLNSDSSLLSLLNAPHSQPISQVLHPEAHMHATPTAPEDFSTSSAAALSAPLDHPPTETVTTPIATTTTIPLQAAAAAAEAAPPVLSPATMSREEALEQIRRRRGRTKSIAAVGTPKSKTPRRDISAPAK
jgi:hypothetical protein